MAQSVKLKDGSYIDTEGIYDVTQGKTQKDINAQLSGISFYKDVTSSTSFTFKPPSSPFLILSRYGVFHVNNNELMTVASIGDRTYTLAVNSGTVTFTASNTLWGGILVIG